MRRILVITIAAMSVVSARAQGARVSLDEFIAVSERLLQRANLDRETAQLYLTAIDADPDAAVTLAYIVQSNGNPTPEQKVLSATIVEWWRTGVYRIDGEPRLAARSRAMWSPYPKGFLPDELH
jgi:hypothetical protein